MEHGRIHRATSADGTDIVGSVRGHGPPLVLVHAGLGDGDLDCGDLASQLEDRFTCYLPSTRNRGLSGHSDDLGLERHIEDLVAFVESLEQPASAVTWSGGAIAMLGAAARTPAVAAVAVYEPIVVEQLDDQDSARFQTAVEHMAELAEQGRLTEAVRDWMVDYADEEEMAALASSDYLAAAARYVPVLLGELEQLSRADATSPTDPEELARITSPVLVLQGSRSTRRWFAESARHVAEHVPDAVVRQVSDAGHSGMLVEPGAIADELGSYLTTRHAYA